MKQATRGVRKMKKVERSRFTQVMANLKNHVLAKRVDAIEYWDGKKLIGIKLPCGRYLTAETE